MIEGPSRYLADFAAWRRDRLLCSCDTFAVDVGQQLQLGSRNHAAHSHGHDV